MKIRSLSKAALISAMMCVISPFTVPVGVIPLSLSTFGVYVSAVVLEPLYAVLSVVVYLLLGATGLPVFSGATGGIGVITGPTGGFLAGYVLCAFFASVLKNKIKTVPALVTGTFLVYISGAVWFAFVTQSSLAQAFFVCILPFLPGDALKIAVSAVVGGKIIKVVKHGR